MRNSFIPKQKIMLESQSRTGIVIAVVEPGGSAYDAAKILAGRTLLEDGIPSEYISKRIVHAPEVSKAPRDCVSYLVGVPGDHEIHLCWPDVEGLRLIAA